MKVEAISETSVKVQVIPPTNSAAQFYSVSIEEPSLGRECWVYFGQSHNSCTYKDLKLGQKYKFMYRLAKTIGYHDIVSENRYKVYTMPAVGKLIRTFLIIARSSEERLSQT